MTGGTDLRLGADITFENLKFEIYSPLFLVAGLQQSFRPFGPVKVEWPIKEVKPDRNTPKGRGKYYSSFLTTSILWDFCNIAVSNKHSAKCLLFHCSTICERGGKCWVARGKKNYSYLYGHCKSKHLGFEPVRSRRLKISCHNENFLTSDQFSWQRSVIQQKYLNKNSRNNILFFRLLLLTIWKWKIGESVAGKLYAWFLEWRGLVFQDLQ